MSGQNSSRRARLGVPDFQEPIMGPRDQLHAVRMPDHPTDRPARGPDQIGRASLHAANHHLLTHPLGEAPSIRCESHIRHARNSRQHSQLLASVEIEKMERSIRSVGGKPSGARHRGGAACAPRQAKCCRARIHRQPFQRGQIIRDGLLEGRLPGQRPDQKVVIRVGRCVGQSIGTEAVPVQPVTNCESPAGRCSGRKDSGRWSLAERT